MKKLICFVLLSVLVFGTLFAGESQASSLPVGLENFNLSGQLLAQNPVQQSYNTSCVTRGDTLNSGYVALCSLCYQAQRLSEQYYPTFVNGVSCTLDTKALSGYGTCIQEYITVNILYNEGTQQSPQYTPAQITVPSACVPTVLSGSLLFDFVRQ